MSCSACAPPSSVLGNTGSCAGATAALTNLNSALGNKGTLESGELLFLTRRLKYKVTFGSFQYKIQESLIDEDDFTLLGVNMTFGQAVKTIPLFGPFV